MAVKKETKALLPNCDRDGIAAPTWPISTVLKGDAEIVLMHVYGHVDLGIKGTNFEILLGESTSHHASPGAAQSGTDVRLWAKRHFVECL